MRVILERYLILAFSIIFKTSLFGQVTFIDVAANKGIDFLHGSGAPIGGVSFCDFNKDGLDDLTFASGKGKTISFYINNGNGFTLLDPPLVDNLDEVKQILWIDFNNDGDKDLYFTTLDSRNYLYKNNGNLELSDVTESVGLSLDIAPNYGAAWGDIDRDGWLDLMLTEKKITQSVSSTNRLFRNLGNGSFEEITNSSGLVEQKNPFVISFIDYNNDLWPDIYIAQDKNRINSLFSNQHNKGFKNISKITNSDLSMFGMSVASEDIDGNGTAEIYITNTIGNKLLLNYTQIYSEEANKRGVDLIGGTSWGASFLDSENDGDQDLYVSGMLVGNDVVSSAYYENDGLGKFTKSKAGFIGDTVISYSNAVGDINNDGFIDIVVNNDQPFKAQLWQNSGGTNNWIKIKLKGVISNRDGIGSRIELFLKGRGKSHFTRNAVSYLGQNSDWISFGLANATKADSIHVYWPSGHIEKLYDIFPNQRIVVEEGSITPITLGLNFSGIQSRCRGDSVYLSANLFHKATTYLWSTGDTTPEILITKSGEYSVQINSPFLMNTWNSPTVTFEFNNYSRPQIEALVKHVTCYGYNNGKISTEITGDTFPYSILWSSGETELAISNLQPGYYQISVSDSSPCQATKNFVIKEPDPIVLFPQITEISFGKFAILLNQFGGVAPFTYQWSVSGAPNKPILTNLDPGNYSVNVIDVNGCKGFLEMVINEKEIVTGMERELSAFHIYPNPIDDNYLSIQVEPLGQKCYDLQFFNGLGQMLVSQRCVEKDENRIDIPSSQLFPGINYLIIRSDNEIVFRSRLILR